MVIKGNPRGGPKQLGKHLERTDTNESMRVVEMRDVAADDLTGALQEMDALGCALRTRRTLYHASINTRADETMTPEQRTTAIDRLEAALDLTGQPRIVVEHMKEGRGHIHVVWSRTDLEHMRAIRADHNYRTHEEVARDLEREFGHARVQGAHAERDGQERPERTPSHAEMQQAERTGLSPKEAREQITEIWNRTDSGKALAAALEENGWTLARGDKRDFVVIDPHGETHSLARRIEGAKAKDVRERMADVDAASLPSVDEARDQQRARQVARDEAQRPQPDLAATAPARESEPPSVEPAHELADRVAPEPVHATALPAAESRQPGRDAAPVIPAQPEIPAATPPPEIDFSHRPAAAGGNVAAEQDAAPTLPLAETPPLVASRDAADSATVDPSSRAAEPAAASMEPAPAHAEGESSTLAAPVAESLHLVGGMARGAIVVLDAAAGVAEAVIGLLDGLAGGASADPKQAKAAQHPPPPKPPPLTAKQRYAARVQAAIQADEEQRHAALQERAHRLGASEALTDKQLDWEKEAQEKRSQDRDGGISR